MIYTKFTFILIVFCFSLGKPNQILTHSINDEFKEDSIIKIYKHNKVTLKYKSPLNIDQFEPKFFDRLILINDEFLLNVDSICAKSELFNESFNYYPNCIIVTKDCKNKFKLTISLGQKGCVGDFCKDLIEFNIVIFNGKLKYQYKEKVG